VAEKQFSAVEICAGAGGQSLGLERAGFAHDLAVEIDVNAAATLQHNRPHWKVAIGDVADSDVWNPEDFHGIDLLAGGVPCPPFSIAGKQRGATDERDLFAWAVDRVGVMEPKALLLENVRGLSTPRFSGYRQHVLDVLSELGYIAEWTLLQASDFGLAQLRPRFVLVALKPETAPYFHWPEPLGPAPTVGEALYPQMAANGWSGAEAWSKRASGVGPTIVGGSKKHGGADLGPTRAKRAWAELGVDGMGVANEPPNEDTPYDHRPKLTVPMVATLQGWDVPNDWEFTGKKTSAYRQVGNAFPPPVAEAVGRSIMRALKQEGEPRDLNVDAALHDPVLRVLKSESDFLPLAAIAEKSEIGSEAAAKKHLDRLMNDFVIEVSGSVRRPTFKLVEFKAFVGQEGHSRHEVFEQMRSRIS